MLCSKVKAYFDLEIFRKTPRKVLFFAFEISMSNLYLPNARLEPEHISHRRQKESQAFGPDALLRRKTNFWAINKNVPSARMSVHINHGITSSFVFQIFQQKISVAANLRKWELLSDGRKN